MSAVPTLYDYSPLQTEVIALHDVRRTAHMWSTYYGGLLARWAQIGTALQVVAGAGSSAGVMALVSANPQWAVVLSAAAALCAVFYAVLGVAERLRRYDRAHGAHGLVYGQADLLLTEIRRAGALRPEHTLAVTQLHQLQAAAHALDSEAPDTKRLRRAQNEVDEALPPDTLWLPRDER